VRDDNTPVAAEEVPAWVQRVNCQKAMIFCSREYETDLKNTLGGIKVSACPAHIPLLLRPKLDCQNPVKDVQSLIRRIHASMGSGFDSNGSGEIFQMRTVSLFIIWALGPLRAHGCTSPCTAARLF
jgi:hypothetical protein